MIYNKQNLDVVKILDSRDGVHPYKNVVRFTKNNTVATNGHILLESKCVNSNPDENETVYINKKDLRGLKLKKDDVVSIKNNALHCGEKIIKGVENDIEYPEYKQVFREKDTPVVEIKMNPEYLIRMMKAFKDDVTLKVYDDCIIFQSPYLHGVIMHSKN